MKKNHKDICINDLDPRVLSTNDIIFIGLKTLKQEFHLSNFSSNDQSKRFTSDINQYYPPPILCLEFNIVIVDETQKIEGDKISQILMMAMKLKASNRISVSGND